MFLSLWLRSIFDIEKSPFSGAGIEKLLAPIMSPANLSDVSDLADNGHAVALMAESAAEVPLEPGQYDFRVAISDICYETILVIS